MVFSAQRVLVFLICIGVLAVEPDKVSGLRSIDLVLRQSQEDHMLAPKNQRILKAVVVEDLNREENAAPVNKKFDQITSTNAPDGYGCKLMLKICNLSQFWYSCHE